ncbi:MAG: hypothetical protein XD93_0834, partial [candidate division WS6 bacterium 34_10]
WTPAEVGFCKVGSTATPNYDQLSSSFPEPGETVSWVCSNADGSVNCEASRIDSAGGIPQTGIFDTVLGRVSVGVSFIFLGGLVSQYSRINYFFNSVSEKNQFRREINKQRRKEKRIQRRREKLEDNFKGK